MKSHPIPDLTPDNVAIAEQEPTARLIAAAGPVFARAGFDKATVRQIATRAGVNPAAVNYYFGDKMGLYRAVVVSIRQQRAQQFPAPKIGAESPQKTLHRLVRTLLSRILAGDAMGWETQLMIREMMQPTAVLDEVIEQYFRPLYDALCQTIEQLLPADAFRRDQVSDDRFCREALVPQMALGVVGQCLHHLIGRSVIEKMIPSSIRARHYDPDSLCDHITAMTLAACDQQDVIHHRQQLQETPASPFSS